MQSTQNSDVLRSQARRLYESLGLSGNQAAKEIGISGSALSQWINDKYNADPVEIERKILSWIERRQEMQEMPRETRFERTVETSVYCKVTAAIRHAHLQGKIGMVTASAGAGKTRTIKDYVDKNPGAILIECHHSYPIKAVLQEIAEHLAIEVKGDIHTMLKAITERLRGSQRVIILDEAEHLKPQVLDVVRRIWDFAGVGIVYVGLPRFASTVRSLRGEYNYIARRVRVKQEIMLTAQDAQKDIERLLHGALPGADRFAELFSSFCGADFGQAEELFFMSLRVAESVGEALSDRLIRSVAKQLDLNERGGAG